MVLYAEPPPPIKLLEGKITGLADDANQDSPKLERRTRTHHIERHRSCVMTLSDIELNDVPPRRQPQTFEVTKSPGGASQCSAHEEKVNCLLQRHATADAAWEALKRSIVYFRGQPIGTVAAIDKSQGAALSYGQVFMRDFIPSALAFLMKGEHLIVKNFLVETARLQSREKMVDLFKLGQGVMPASFKVHHRSPTQKTESLLADFGETAIGRVAPVDSVLWWILLLRAYTKWTGDNSLAESPNCQRAMRLILRLCLSEGCDTSPALLCADGCSMIDRRMAPRCGLSLLKQDSEDDFVNHITKRIQTLSYHLHSYYWLDFQRLSDIYRHKTAALNKFSVIPEAIPDWIFDFMPSRAGYFIGNVSPARMDFRWFCLGNFISILSSLATGEQAEAILDLVEERWEELTGEMPLKICYPPMENQEWQIVTSCEPKSTRCRYQNAGSCPGTRSRLGRPLQVSNNPGGASQCSAREEAPVSRGHAIAAAWEALKYSIVYFRGQPIGTAAAIYKFQEAALNYDQVFTRDIIPSALAFLMKGEEHLKNVLVETFHLVPIDFLEAIIGRVDPFLSNFWWIILRAAYTKWASDNSVAINTIQWAIDINS